MRIAIIGFGFMGLTHAKYIDRVSGLELAAIISRRPRDQLLSDARRLNEKMAVDLDVNRVAKVEIYPNLAGCLEKQRIDAVSICLPVSLHLSTARHCLESGLHVLLEKPFCLEVQQGQELIDLAEERNLVLMVAHHVRFHYSYVYLQKCIDSGRLGSLNLLVLFKAGGRPSWGSWTDRGVAQASGGALFDLQIHDVDYCNWVLGTPARIRTSLMTENYLDTALFYPDKLKVCIQGGWVKPPMPYESFYIAEFEHGCVKYSRRDPEVILETDGLTVEQIDIRKQKSSYQVELEHFLDLMTGDTESGVCTPTSCLESVSLCHRIKAGNPG
jgi:predicted dehydrogenase